MRRLLILLIVLGLMPALVLAQDGAGDRFVGTVDAPDFPSDADWFNVEQPLTLDGLRGKIVVLDFWTYGCINCIHMIPVLEQIEQKYADEVVVIGVHSAKFDNEGQSDNIRQIIRRYNLHHPVINDSDFEVWRSYGAQAWPTAMIIDPRGGLVARQSGEIPFTVFDQYLSEMIAYYDGLGTDEISREPLALALEGAGDPGTPLLFPGKVLVDSQSGRLFIADSNHHRIVVADLASYEVQTVIGTGQRGSDDGDFADASFNQPQGMALRDEVLYIADVNNHAIRTADLSAGTVATIAGTGRMGRSFVPFDTVIDAPLTIDLRSPWDLEFDDAGRLHIAMAGTHQLWRMDLDAGTIQPSVGSGREAALNNVALADAELAQPSGLYFIDGLLYFADSESSTIRVADFNTDEVRLIAGTPENNLFDFGDVDGELGQNRLQHALGVDGDPASGLIYIADTYNSRIKVYDPATQITETLFGLGGNGGYRDGEATVAEFDEPGGLDYDEGRLYVADTNNHVIRVIDLNTGQVDTIQFPNPEALLIERNPVTLIGGNAGAGETVTLDEQTVAPGEGSISLSIDLPDGYKINSLITSGLSLSSDGDAVRIEQTDTVIDAEQVSISATFAAGQAVLSAQLTLYYCEAVNESLCLIDEVAFTVPITVADGGADAITLQRQVQPLLLDDGGF